MFWSLILPFQITIVVFCLAIVALLIVALCSKQKRGKILVLGFLSCTLLFIPSCLVIDQVIAPFRFRTFRYEKYEELTYPRAQWYVPPAATDLVVRYRASGYAAKFQINQADLDTWFEQAFETGYDSEFAPSHSRIRPAGEGDLDLWAVTCAQVDWVRPTNAAIYEGPYEGDGGGSTILYDVDEKVAYQDCGIW